MTNTEVKITGFNDKKGLDIMAAKTHTDPAILYRLGLGRFAVKVGKGIRPPTFILYSPTFLLGNANAMSAAEWQALTERQLAAYYKPVEAAAPAEEIPLAATVSAEATEGATAFFRKKSKRLPSAPKYDF